MRTVLVTCVNGKHQAVSGARNQLSSKQTSAVEVFHLPALNSYTTNSNHIEALELQVEGNELLNANVLTGDPFREVLRIMNEELRRELGSLRDAAVGQLLGERWNDITYEV